MTPTSNVQEHIKPENLVYAKPALMNDLSMHYCPGCSHGVVHKLVAETVAEMGLEETTIGVAPVGCAVFAYKYIDIDWQEAAHGRALTKATETLLPSVQQRPSMHVTEERTSSLSSSTMPSTA